MRHFKIDDRVKTLSGLTAANSRVEIADLGKLPFVIDDGLMATSRRKSKPRSVRTD